MAGDRNPWILVYCGWLMLVSFVFGGLFGFAMNARLDCHWHCGPEVETPCDPLP